MAHYRKGAIRAGPASAASRRNAAPIAPKLKMMADVPAHVRETALGRWERPSREALTKREQSTRWHQSQPRLYAVRAPVGGNAMPLDTALVTSRVRARARGAKNATS